MTRADIADASPRRREAPAAAHVLCVEDDPDIRALVELALGPVGGLRVSSCGSGAEALALAAELRPDLVLLDVMMPGMDGIETLRRLRADARTAELPVVFVTAKVQRHEIDAYRRQGALGVIAKPFDPMRLADRVRAFLEEGGRSPAAGGRGRRRG